MVPGRDLVAARPQLLARLTVERIDGRVSRGRYATLGIRIEATADPRTIRLVPGDVGKRLRRVFSRPEREHHTVGHHDLFSHVHVTREPRRVQPPLSRLHLLE